MICSDTVCAVSNYVRHHGRAHSGEEVFALSANLLMVMVVIGREEFEGDFVKVVLLTQTLELQRPWIQGLLVRAQEIVNCLTSSGVGRADL